MVTAIFTSTLTQKTHSVKMAEANTSRRQKRIKERIKAVSETL